MLHVCRDRGEERATQKSRVKRNCDAPVGQARTQEPFVAVDQARGAVAQELRPRDGVGTADPGLRIIAQPVDRAKAA